MLHNFERAEDIPPAAMIAGIPWSWTTFPEYFDAVDALPKGLNYASYVGHSSLRTHVMGERAMEEQASADDLAAMKRELTAGMRAGAIGFSTSRSGAHRTPNGKPVASRLASWDEFSQLVGVLEALGSGIVEIARQNIIADPVERRDELDKIKQLALDSGVPFTFGSSFYKRGAPDQWREQFHMVDECNAAGGKMLIQATATWNGSLRSFETATPYDYIPVWRDFRKLPLADQEKGLRNPEMRKKLVDAVHAHTHKPDPALPNNFQRPVDWTWVFPLTRPLPPYPSIAEIAAERGQDPVETFIDLALDHHLKLFFIQPSNNEDQDFVLALIRHPHAAVTFSDAGAHVATTINPIHGHLLGHWVRDKQAIPLEAAIRKITFDIASFWGLEGRGRLREGHHADVVVFDPGHHIAQHARAGARPAVRRAAHQTAFPRHQGDRGQRPGADPGGPPYRRAARPPAAWFAAPQLTDRGREDGTMKRVKFGPSDLMVSPIGLGCMSMSGCYGQQDDARMHRHHPPRARARRQFPRHLVELRQGPQPRADRQGDQGPARPGGDPFQARQHQGRRPDGRRHARPYPRLHRRRRSSGSAPTIWM